MPGPGGRSLRAFDTGSPGDGRLPVLWHHGTPNIGLPPRPLFGLADELGLRWIGFSRPGYPGSTRKPGRDAASIAHDASVVLDALGVSSFVAMGHSGGGEGTLACAALLSPRCRAAVSISGLAPYDAPGLAWWDGMPEAVRLELATALEGREALAELIASGRLDQLDWGIGPQDEAMLAGPWRWFDEVQQAALGAGPDGWVDDDLAGVAPWGFHLGAIDVPVLVLHGEADGLVPLGHGRWLAEHVPGAELRVADGAGHLSVMHEAPAALAWLRNHGKR